MTQIAIAGIGLTPVGEHWSTSLAELAADAASQALKDANLASADAIFIGNSYSSTYNEQTQLGALIASTIGLHGTEALCIEGGTAAGGLAMRAAYLAVKSGEVSTALVIGAEKVTDIVAGDRIKAQNISLDADHEAIHGATLSAMAALLMRRYMHEYGVEISAFEGFSLNAHANGKRNPYAMYRNTLKPGAFATAPMIAEPVSLFDSAPDGDGAAAVLVTSLKLAEDLVAKPVEVAASAAATDTLALQDRAEPLRLRAVEIAVSKALKQAGIGIHDINALELHDAFTILCALSLEASQLAERGQGWQWAQEGGKRISIQGELPLSTFGGLKSRGNPSGAAGVYQIVESVMQLRGLAGDNQVNGQWIMTQNLGGLGSTAAVHILHR
jgi:acetyl-CoA C-acetyltransferase